MSAKKLDLFRHDNNLQDWRELVMNFIQFSRRSSQFFANYPGARF